MTWSMLTCILGISTLCLCLRHWCARVPAVVFLSIVARPFPWCGPAHVLQLPLLRTMVQACCRSLLLKCFVVDTLRSHVCCALAPFQLRPSLR